jgi:hypothetical protein
MNRVQQEDINQQVQVHRDNSGKIVEVGDTVRIWDGVDWYGIFEYDRIVVVDEDTLRNLGNYSNVQLIEKRSKIQ